ncbi:MAG: peptide deformylase [Mariprofundaceae bacterium]|nr:peptide deformylase [Mariprofundaceae bacterium]
MTIRDILTFPNKKLREVASEVSLPISSDIHALIEDLAQTMYAAPGVGLAATQIGVAKRVAVTDIAWRKEEDSERELHVWINPEIIARSGSEKGEEGCLSLPKVYENVQRATSIKVRWVDLEGQSHESHFEGFQAVALQHEFDHLDGKIFIDHLSVLKRKMVVRRIKKMQEDES